MESNQQLIPQFADIRSAEYYKSNNIFTGSLGDFNYKITTKDDIFTVKIWYGYKNIDLSEIATEKEFPLTDDGVSEITSWLNEQYQLH